MEAQRASFLAAAETREPAGRGGGAALRAVMDELLTRQIAEDDPPEVWATARRLLEAGIDPSDVHSQLRLTLGACLLSAVGEDADLDEAGYVSALGRLPLPSGAQVEAATIAVVRDHQPVGAAEVDRLVAERLGLAPDDPVAESMLDRVQDQLLDDGPLAMLPPDLLVHVPSLVEGIVLTHRLTEQEGRTGVLVAIDLPGLDQLGPLHHGQVRVHAYRGDDGIPRWWGAEGWLSSVSPGALIAVRVQSDGSVTLTTLTEEPEGEPALVTAVRGAYDENVEEPWLPVSSEDLLLAVRAADRAAFTRPARPLSELAAAAGLEQRGDSFAHEESVWQQARLADRAHRVFDRLGSGPRALAALRALTLLDTDALEAGPAHELLDLLYDLAVLEVVADELFGADDDPASLALCASLAEQLVAHASRPGERAVAHWLAAVAAERRGAVEEAESQLRSAVRADPGWPAAEDRLAWYESDRGNAAAAAAGWRRLGLTAEDSADLAAVEGFEAPGDGNPKLGRNQPCWCGSGRKYKQCHLNRRELPPLPERIGWLRRKAVAYLRRRGGAVESVVADHARMLLGEAADDEEALDSAMSDPLVLDVVLHEGGWLQRFLTDRGRLLPDDEAMLAAAWLLCERTVVEVVDAVRGHEVTVRDLRTGDHIAVREHTFSRTAEPGQRLCVRIVPDGETHQFVGAALRVSPGTETRLLEVLDEHDGYELLDYVAALRRPPALVTRDGDPLVDCRAELRVSDPQAARAALDQRYEPDHDGWVSLFSPTDDDSGGVERSVRAVLQLDEDRLTVRTMSGSRLDAVLAELRAALPDVPVLSEQREPVRWSDAPPPTSSPATAPVQVPTEAILELLDRQERRWCDEQVPALGGRTPWQAAADPTRRDELIRLIASFPEIDPASGAFSLRPARLRQLLGLTSA